MYHVITFIGTQVIFFPALCGFLLGLVTLPLFPGATIALRASYLRRAPFPSESGSDVREIFLGPDLRPQLSSIRGWRARLSCLPFPLGSICCAQSLVKA